MGREVNYAEPGNRRVRKVACPIRERWAIRSCDIAPRPNAINPVAKPWKEAARGGSPESIVSIVVSDTVDRTVLDLLDAIDNEELNFSFTAANGKRVDLPTDGLGELAGWYGGSGGWLTLYSPERFIDGASDLVPIFQTSHKEGEPG